MAIKDFLEISKDILIMGTTLYGGIFFWTTKREVKDHIEKNKSDLVLKKLEELPEAIMEFQEKNNILKKYKECIIFGEKKIQELRLKIDDLDQVYYDGLTDRERENFDNEYENQKLELTKNESGVKILNDLKDKLPNEIDELNKKIKKLIFSYGDYDSIKLFKASHKYFKQLEKLEEENTKKYKEYYLNYYIYNNLLFIKLKYDVSGVKIGLELINTSSDYYKLEKKDEEIMYSKIEAINKDLLIKYDFSYLLSKE